MPRRKTEICIVCDNNEANDGRYCHSCRSKRRRAYFRNRYWEKGGYGWQGTQTKEFKLKQKLSERSGGVCEHCGWNKAKEILQIHHKDRNKGNNNLGNVELLCPTCHIYHHYLEGTGLFHSDKAKYLPVKEPANTEGSGKTPRRERRDLGISTKARDEGTFRTASKKEDAESGRNDLIDCKLY